MSSDPVFIVLNFAAWLDTTNFEQRILGAIVQSCLQPTNNYVPENPLQYNSKVFVEGSFDDFVANTAMTASHEVSASLETLTSFRFRGSTSDSVHLKGKRIRWKRLQQHQQFWDKLKENPDVKSLLPAWVEQGGHWHPPYLVVGIMICEDMEVAVDKGKEHEETFQGKVPVMEAAGAAAGGVPAKVLGGIGDPNIGFEHVHQVKNDFEAKVGGSRIFALELRKVKSHWWTGEIMVQDERPGLMAYNFAQHEETSDRIEGLGIEIPSGEDFDVLDNLVNETSQTSDTVIENANST